jgi:hypothetical protein
MPDKETRRLPFILNWILLGSNAVLLVALAWSWLSAKGPTEKARASAQLLGMDIYAAKGPFAIFVDKDFPRRYEFTMHDYSRPLVVNVTELDREAHNNPRMSAQIVADPDVAISCDYTLVDDHGSYRALIDNVSLQTKTAGFDDMNVDGHFDSRVNHEADLMHRQQIWYDGEWRDVVPAAYESQYERRLCEVGEVVFDRKTGRWTPEGEQDD